MSCNKRLRKIGVVKSKDFKNDFDNIYDMFRKKANDLGFDNDLKFIKDKNRVNIYIEYDNII
jgi:hypothetical protein